MDTLPSSSDDVSAYFSSFAGTHFVAASFAENPLVHCITRTYQRFLDQQLAAPVGGIMDFGCGDGRLSLWAVRNNVGRVVAMDNNLPALKRLAAHGRDLESKNLLVVCADAKHPPFLPGSFDAVLCFEVLYYLVPSLGRIGAIKVAAELVKPGGKLLLSESTRYGRALLDIAAMNLENGRSLVERSTRFEKAGDLRLEVFHWTVAELKQDCTSLGLKVIAEIGVSPVPSLFHHAWTFTSYPLRPLLGLETQQLIEGLSDATAEVSETARNLVLALKCC